MFCLYKDTKLLTNKQVVNKKKCKIILYGHNPPITSSREYYKKAKIKNFHFLLSILEIFDLP